MFGRNCVVSATREVVPEKVELPPPKFNLYGTI
jgi:hypothetical protein